MFLPSPPIPLPFFEVPNRHCKCQMINTAVGIRRGAQTRRSPRSKLGDREHPWQGTQRALGKPDGGK